jgi:hypothetical protein
MNRRTLTTLALLSFALVVATASHIGLAQTNLVGKWSLNVEKSKFNPGPAPKSSVLTYELEGQGVKVTNEGVNAAGNPTKSVFGPFTHDGKPSPVTGIPDFNESTYKEINNTTVEFTRLKDGKPVQTGTRVLAADGKTLTFSTTGVNAAGQQINNVAVYEKQ